MTTSLQTRLATEWQALRLQGRRHGNLVTSTDLIKALALINMVMDHLGFFFFPDEPMWRAVGRIGVPVWLFLAGYARPSRMSLWLPAGGFFLLAVDVSLGRPLFPLNILFTIMLTRWVVQFIPVQRVLNDILLLMALPLFAVAAYFYSNLFLEYGTVGLLLGIWGRIMREAPDSWARRLFALLCLAVFLFLQQLVGEFKVFAYLVMCAGVTFTFGWLYVFQPRIYPASESWYGLAPVVRFLGRHTLGFYVWHLTLFTLLWAWLNPAEIKGFHWF